MSAASYRVTAPNPEYDGKTGKCQFSNGVYEGAVEEGTLIYFEQAGYAVQALNDAAEGHLDDPPAEDLKGKALDDALADASLPTTGKADAKRERLAEYRASLAAENDDDGSGDGAENGA